MRTFLRRALLAALMIAGTGCASVYDRGLRPAVVDAYGPNNGYDVWTFHDSLDPYGRWFEYPGYGWVWSPSRTSSDWRPYSDGQWVDSDYGWTWLSDEPWGWAPYHYGRWLDDPNYGWVWVPGTEWAPAWVAWRYDDDWIGWAPLPPDAAWSDAGLSGFASDGIPASRWSFVPRRQFLEDRLDRLTVPVARNTPLLAETRDATAFEVRSGHPYNRGIDRTLVERMTGRRVKHVTVADALGPGRAEIVGDQVEFYRPTLQEPDAAPAIKRQMDERRAAIERERQRRLQLQADEEKRLAAERDREAEARRVRDTEAQRAREMEAGRTRITDAQRARGTQARRTPDTDAQRARDDQARRIREARPARSAPAESAPSDRSVTQDRARSAPTGKSTSAAAPRSTPARGALSKSASSKPTTAAQRREMARRRAYDAAVAEAREKARKERERKNAGGN